jgi:hypothetical protein
LLGIGPVNPSSAPQPATDAAMINDYSVEIGLVAGLESAPS